MDFKKISWIPVGPGLSWPSPIYRPPCPINIHVNFLKFIIAPLQELSSTLGAKAILCHILFAAYGAKVE